MGGVELLSREGEIAIAKRIEAGKDVMINALTQSPIVGKIFEWKEQIESQQMLVRDIIDIDSTYEDFEALDEDDNSKTSKKSKDQESREKLEDEDKDVNSSSEDDEFIILAKMEEEIKPKL